MTTKSDISATVLRALKILEHLKKVPGPQSVSYISRDLDLAPTIVHRLLTTLKMEGFVFQDSQSKLYSLGSVFLEYANKMVTELPFAPVVEPWLIHLRNQTLETTGLYIPYGHTYLCVMEYESMQEIKRAGSFGEQLPIYSGATGRAICSFHPEQSQKQVMKSLNTENKFFLQQEFQETKKRGYAVSIDEMSVNVTVISAPIFDQKGVIGAISVSGPSYRFNSEKIDKYATYLLQATHGVSSSFV